MLLSVSFSENKNSAVINQIKQILLSSFLANTSGTTTQWHPCNLPEQEDGFSGHKVRAENRDKLQIIKGHARQGKYGYDLVKSGRLNKRKHALYELAVNEDEAKVAKLQEQFALDITTIAA